MFSQNDIFRKDCITFLFLHKAFYKPGQTVQVCELKVHLRNIWMAKLTIPFLHLQILQTLWRNKQMAWRRRGTGWKLGICCSRTLQIQSNKYKAINTDNTVYKIKLKKTVPDRVMMLLKIIKQHINREMGAKCTTHSIKNLWNSSSTFFEKKVLKGRNFYERIEHTTNPVLKLLNYC